MLINILIMLSVFTGCSFKSACWEPDVIQRIGMCDDSGLCSVITETGYISREWYPIVGQKIKAKVKCKGENNL